MFEDESSLDKLRRKLGNRFEHVETSGPHKGVWIYGKAWFAAIDEARRTPFADSPHRGPDGTIDHADRLKKAQADKAELELAQLRGELLTVADAKRSIDVVLAKFRSLLERLGRINRDAQRIAIDGLNEAEKEWNRLNGDGNHESQDR